MYKLVGCSVLALLLVGCDEKVATNRPVTSPVTGMVTYNGDPVEGALVTFRTKSEGGRGATGTTDASGKFSMLTFEPGDGAIPGSYGVTVQKTTIEAMTPEETMAMMDRGAGIAELEGVEENSLPDKYKDENTSELTADVKDGPGNEFTFELKD